MEGKKFLLIGLLAFAGFFLAATGVWAQDEEAENCIICHEWQGGDRALPVIEWRSSTHQIEGITCSSCHGGNPDIKLPDLDRISDQEFRRLSNAAMYDAEDFVGKPVKEDQFELCGNCHYESVEVYKNSIMGEAYLKDKGGPSCVKCHGAHYNKMPEVPESCKDCHSDVSGYDQISAMNVTEQTIDELYQIRTEMALAKVKGEEVKIFPEELESFQIGFITIGIIFLLLVLAMILYYTLERRA
jgi:nitrate/TMAO reductase-like tetraheme cytochrome c subunit